MSTELMVVENKLYVEVRRGNGSLVEVYAGPSEDQLKAQHDQGLCSEFCGYCYDGATR